MGDHAALGALSPAWRRGVSPSPQPPPSAILSLGSSVSGLGHGVSPGGASQGWSEGRPLRSGCPSRPVGVGGGQGQQDPAVCHISLALQPGPLRCPQHLPPGAQEDMQTRPFSLGRGPPEGQGVLPGALPAWSPQGLAQRPRQDCRLACRGQHGLGQRKADRALTEDAMAGMGRSSNGTPWRWGTLPFGQAHLSPEQAGGWLEDRA